MSDLRKTYRIYCFDASDMTVSGDVIKAHTDEEAIAKAEARGIGSKCEIWEGDRLVAQLGDALRA